jgi:preprotein translocase subunit SecG
MSSTVLTLANILYVLVAVAMIVMILLQRGAGAAAGSGFGAGASATVFGARGSANFLSKSTAVLAVLFFVISLGMAMYVSRGGFEAGPAEDLGVMGQLTPAAADAPSEVEATESAPAIPEALPAPAPAPAPVAVEAEAAAESDSSADEGREIPPSEGDSGE